MERVGKKELIHSSIWKMLETLSTKGVSVVISIILARLLNPDSYGVVAVSDVFINFSVLLVQSGLSTALIRKEKVDDLDYSNVFFFSMAVATLCYAGFFFAAGPISVFYHEPLVANVLRVQMLSLFLCAIGTVRNAIIVRQFRFKQLAMINFAAVIVGGLTGIIIAYRGGGVWALVVYTLVRDAVSCFLLFFAVRWKLIFRIASDRLKALLLFSIWVLVAAILDFVANNIYNLAIGRAYTMADLGYFNKGGQLPQMVCVYTFGAISSVLLPALAQVQTDKEVLKHRIRRMVQLSAYVIFPMIAGLAVVGNRLVLLLFTAKWLPCVPILWASCISFGVNPFRSISVQTLYAVGNSRKVLAIELFRFFLLAMGLVLGISVFHISVNGLAFIMAAIAVINAVISQYCIVGVSSYTIPEWLRDMCMPALMTFIMCVVIVLLNYVPNLPDLICLILQIAVGVAVYVGLSVAFKQPLFYEVLDMLKIRRK